VHHSVAGPLLSLPFQEKRLLPSGGRCGPNYGFPLPAHQVVSALFIWMRKSGKGLLFNVEALLRPQVRFVAAQGSE